MNNPTDQAPSSSLSSAASSIRETRNVLYRGTMRDAGVSIFMQGTHRLELDDGRFILLESDTVDLNSYINKRTEVYGAVRPTEESGGMIMRVESILILEASSFSFEESSAVESSSSAISSQITSSKDSSSSSKERSVRSSSVAPASSAMSSLVAPISSITPASSEATSSVFTSGSAELDAKAAIMAKDNLSPVNWTQQYCSSHIKFCIPVHRNWWFMSFGATTSALWHMEIAPSELNFIGDGPITVRLVSGSAAAIGGSDNQVSVAGGFATGYREWDGGRHFEVRGPSALQAAVTYITQSLIRSQ